MKILLTVCRVLVGLLFIFSGIIKANDPIGFSYKLAEYFDEVFHMAFLVPYSLPLAIFMVVLEIVLGVQTLFGIRMKGGAWLLLLLIIYFTILTGASAIFKLVQECGCFGDAIPLTPYQSFMKDIVLSLMIMVIFWKRKEIKPVFSSKKISSIIFIASIVLSAAFTLYCYNYLPVWDFRPYAKGKNIKEQMKTLKPAKYLSIMAYKNKTTGELEDNLFYPDPAHPEDSAALVKKGYKAWPWRDSTWGANHVFVADKSRSDLVDPGIPAKITDFSLADHSNMNVTDSILNIKDYNFWIVIYDVTEAKMSSIKNINELSKQLDAMHITVSGFSSNSREETDLFRQENDLQFPFYSCDRKVLQTIIRSNPGIVLVKDGVVMDMWSKNGIPSIETLKSKYLK